jgi:hypothetical protein
VQKSFDFITSLYEHTTLVFMSATMSHIRPLIEKRIISLHLDRAEYWAKYRRDYESDFMEAEGYEDGLADIVESRTELEDDPDYIFEMSELEKAIVPPRVREYQFLRDLSKNLKVMRFGTVDELIDVIENDYYPGKWLIFVSSKSIGKRIRDRLLENDQKQRNVVYVDAEYDELSDTEDEVRQQALKEVTYITREKKFQCDILITTAVLDNGVNIMDDRVKNIVLMTDDEDEFMQMLGRRRFTNKQEVVNLFISNGNVGTFKKRMRRYFETFWELCEKPEISVFTAQEMLLSDPIQMVHNLSAYYRLNGFKYSCNELALETIRTKYMFCNDVLTGLENDESYFLQVQLGWLGMELTSQWRDNSNVSVSNDETNGLTEEFAQQLINVAAKIDPTSFRGKSGSIKTVNSALKLRKEWQDYQIKTGGDDTTFYEMFLEGKPHNCIPEGMTPQKLRQIVDEVDTDDFCLIFQRLFETEVPMCLKKDAKGLQVFINQKLISYPGMENVILKSMGRSGEKKIRISRKPQRKNDN